MAKQNWITRLLKRKPERRELKWDWMRNIGIETTAGVSVSETTSLQCSAVYACVRVRERVDAYHAAE